MTDGGRQNTVGVQRKRRWTRWASSILTVCGVIFLCLLAGLIYFNEAIIDSIYKNVAYVTDGEMPVTVTSYPSGPDVASIIGGSGEGLNCSLPPLADLFFDDGDAGDGLRHLVRQKFRQACVFHDLCYRHGLATYGYTQNDCDRILQEQANRLCEYLPKPEKSADQCQRDAKKVLAGVSIGGFGSYRAWDRSTFFEFDPHPLRAQKFSVSRVVDHPFISVDPEKYKEEGAQVILSFQIKRSELQVDCASCARQTILAASRQATNVSKELMSVGINARPEALIDRSLELSGPKTVWLPPWRHHAAPHLLMDATGSQQIVWASRLQSENTVVCVVTASSGQLLTHTLPQNQACSPSAKSPLRLAEFDIFSSAPQPASTLAGNIVTTGLTGQRGTGLELCRWPHADRATKDAPQCLPLATVTGQSVRDLGAFQNFPIIKAQRHIYVSRAITDNPDLNHKVTLWDRLFGDWNSSKGRALIVTAPYGAAASTAGKPTQAVISVPFDISDEYDPMMPVSRTDPGNNHLLSIVARNDQAGIFLLDFANDWPVPTRLATRMNNAELLLHKSWTFRPTIVVETKVGDAMMSRLVFSRSLLVPAEAKGRETVLLEILVLQRGLNDSAEKPYEAAASALCKIAYSIRAVREGNPCLRTFAPDYSMRSSPGAMLQGGQMLVGRFNRQGEPGVALTDACFTSNPIILNPGGAGGRTFTAAQRRVPVAVAQKRAPRSHRTVDCVASNDPQRMNEAMDAKWAVAFAE